MKDFKMKFKFKLKLLFSMVLIANITLAAESSYLYVSSHDQNLIATYRVNLDGSLTNLNKNFMLHDVPEDFGTYEDASGQNKFIYLAYFNLNKIAVIRAKSDGSLTLVGEYNTMVVQPDPQSAILNDKYLYVNSASMAAVDGFEFNNQTGELTHMKDAPFRLSGSSYGYAFSPNNQFLYEQYIYSNQFAAVPVAENGMLGTGGTYVDQSSAKVNTGGFPFHYTMYDGYLYVNTINSNGLSVYKIDESQGSFTPYNSYPTQNLDYKYSFVALRMSRFNNFLYITDTSNNVNVFSIESDHHIKPVQTISCGGVLGRSVIFGYADHGYAYQPIRDSNKISSYQIDANSGKLTFMKSYDAPLKPFHMTIFRWEQ